MGKNNQKSWMTKGIKIEWLTELNKNMQRQKRNFLLFIDNAKCHPIYMDNI